MSERRPAGGSCPRCGQALDLSAAKVGDEWYCTRSCGTGSESLTERESAVPRPWLYARPRRYFRRRAPLELKRPR